MLASVSLQEAIINTPQRRGLNKDLASRLTQKKHIYKSLTFTPQDVPLG